MGVRKKPTFKQKAFAKKYIENKGNASKAALEVYDVKPNEAHTMGYQNLQKPIVQQTIKELMDKNGLDLETLTLYTNTAIEAGIKEGKPTFAAGIDMLKFAYKLHNAIPDKVTKTIREEHKIVLSQDFNVLKEELTQTISSSQELLKDL